MSWAFCHLLITQSFLPVVAVQMGDEQWPAGVITPIILIGEPPQDCISMTLPTKPRVRGAQEEKADKLLEYSVH